MSLIGSILPFRNKLAFPVGVNPRFDPTHPVMAGASKCRLSAIPVGSANYANLLNGSPGTSTVGTGSFTAKVDSLFGPVIGFNTGTDVISFPASVTENNVTLACFFRPFALFVTGVLLVYGPSGYAIIQTGSAILVARDASGTNISSGVTLVNNIPYFIVVSLGNSLANFVVINLSNNQITTTSAVANTAASSVGSTITVGNYVGAANNASNTYNGPVAIIANYLTVPELLLAFGADPWAFWYPRTPIDWVGKKAAAAVPPFVRRNIIRASAKGFR